MMMKEMSSIQKERNVYLSSETQKLCMRRRLWRRLWRIGALLHSRVASFRGSQHAKLQEEKNMQCKSWPL